MEPLKRSATKMLNTLTGKIPEKISNGSSKDSVETFDPLPSLEELDSSQASTGAASSELFSSSDSSFSSMITNNLIAILAGIALIAFTIFNVMAYYSGQKDKDKDKDKGAPPQQTASLQDTITKSLTGAYASAYEKVTKYFNETKEEDAVAPATVPVPAPKKKVATTVKNQVPGITSSKRATTNQSQEVMSEDEDDDNAEVDTLDAALKNASSGSSYKANNAYSSVKAEAGWCYVGEEKGYRNCVEVGENDKCMSGDIFPTSQVCVNPSLRA
jgi:hypothetical protein